MPISAGFIGPSFQFLADNLDQVDLALDQLAVRDRNFDRFAFMLIDNVVELTLHWYAEELHRENELWIRLQKPKYDQVSINDAVGNRFGPKVALAVTQGLLTVDEGNTIRSLHSFRNTTYHQGRRHEGVLHSLAAFYVEVACSLLSNFDVSSSSSDDKIPFRALKYVGGYQLPDLSLRFNEAWERISHIAKSEGRSLVVDLSEDMQNVIVEFDSHLSFLATDGPKQQFRDDVIVECQAWELGFSDEGRKYASDNGYTPLHEFDLVEWLKKNYPWSVRKDPVPSWEKRLASLQSEIIHHAALRKYDEFMRGTGELRRIVRANARHLDDEISSQVDAARGN